MPGNLRHPGCGYKQWFDLSGEGYEQMAFAHIVSTGNRLIANVGRGLAGKRVARVG